MLDDAALSEMNATNTGGDCKGLFSSSDTSSFGLSAIADIEIDSPNRLGLMHFSYQIAFMPGCSMQLNRLLKRGSEARLFMALGNTAWILLFSIRRQSASALLADIFTPCIGSPYCGNFRKIYVFCHSHDNHTGRRAVCQAKAKSGICHEEISSRFVQVQD